MLILVVDPNPPKKAAVAIGLEACAAQREAVDTDDDCSQVLFAMDTRSQEAGWIEAGTVAKEVEMTG